MTTRNKISHQLSNYPFHFKIKTRWKDMDVFGHVNNAVFLTYLEDARITFFHRWNLIDDKRSIIVAAVKIDYLRQIDHPSHLIIGEKISRIGRKSFDIESAVFIQDKEDPIALSIITCVCFDYAKNKSVSIYPEVIADYKKS